MLSKWKTNLVNHVFATNHLINSLLGEIILNYILIPLWSENNLSQKHLSKDKRFTLSLYFRWIRAQVAVSQASTSGPHQEHSKLNPPTVTTAGYLQGTLNPNRVIWHHWPSGTQHSSENICAVCSKPASQFLVLNRKTHGRLPHTLRVKS